MPADVRQISLRELGRGVWGLLGRLPGVWKLVRTLAPARPETLLSLGSALEQTAARLPAQPAVWFEGRSLSYAELNTQANRVARVLRRRGVRAGSVALVLCGNRPELLVLVAALAKLGAQAALLNSEQRRASLQHSLRCVEARCLILGEELASVWQELEDPPPLRVLWLSDTGHSPAQGVDLLLEAAGEGGSNLPETARVRLKDPAFLIFTSGTTGLPKASIMSHQRWIGAGLMFGAVCLQLGPGDTLYAPLPLFHNHALTVCWSSALQAGATLAIRRRFSASRFWHDCRNCGATGIAYIGEVVRYLLEQPVTPLDRAHRVRKAVGLGLRPELFRHFKRRFGVREVYEYYGASELNSGFFNVLNIEGTVGICPSPWAIVACEPGTGRPLRGPSGRLRRVPSGEPGLLLLQVGERFAFDGYTDKAASQRKLLRDVFAPGDLWVSSGDLMRHVGFGHLQFVDRLGDTFRWKGENVATAEVEGVLRRLPGIRAAAVYGVEVPGSTGRAGMAALVGDAELDLAGLLQALRRDLPRHARPVFVRHCPRLETTSTFKVRKAQLRAQGYDPARVADPVFVLLPRASGYVPLTAKLYTRILEGGLPHG